MKTLGQELYELLNPYDPHAGANPATWDQVDEDWHAHYERCAAEFRRRQFLALAEMDLPIEAIRAADEASGDDSTATQFLELLFKAMLRELAKESDQGAAIDKA